LEWDEQGEQVIVRRAGRYTSSDVHQAYFQSRPSRKSISDVVAMALEQFRSRPALGFSDCLVLEVARKAGHLPVGTFDRDFAKLEGVHRL
jgi:predicted nucleic acid-binding protein